MVVLVGGYLEGVRRVMLGDYSELGRDEAIMRFSSQMNSDYILSMHSGRCQARGSCATARCATETRSLKPSRTRILRALIGTCRARDRPRRRC